MADDDSKPDVKPEGDDLERMREALRKANAQATKDRLAADELRKELAKLQSDGDGKKSEMDRLREQMAEIQKRADEAEAARLRAEVGQEKGLSKWAASKLTGSTREELEADADAYLAEHKNGGGKSDDNTEARPSGRQREALRGGATPPSDAGGDKFDEAKFLADVPRG